jgi:5'-AMP-activated protein kinase regulatory beta subunit
MGATESKDRLVGSPSFSHVPVGGLSGEAAGSVPEPPQTPQLKCAVPVAFRWHHGASREVYVVGSFSNWQTKIRLTREPVGDAYATVVQIVPGIHQYKFIVDGEWRCAQVCFDCTPPM